MTYDRSEYADLVAEKQTQRLNGQRQNFEIARQQAVKAELLTGDPNWDAFLSYIQTAIDESENAASSYRVTLESPHTVDPNEIMAAKVALIAANNRIAAWKAVLQLPKDLIEHGKDAKELLDKLDG